MLAPLNFCQSWIIIGVAKGDYLIYVCGIGGSILKSMKAIKVPLTWDAFIYPLP